MQTRNLRAPLVGFLVVLAGAFPAGAVAEPTVVTCEKQPGPGPVTVVTQGGQYAELAFRRVGDEMRVFDIAGGVEERPIACGPAPMDLDQITDVKLDDNVNYSSSFVIDQRGGPFEPGAGPDDGTPEIEFDLPVYSGFNSAAFIAAPDRPSAMYFGRLPTGAGADLNGDGDVDVRWGATLDASVAGSDHSDVIDMSGGRAPFIAGYRPGETFYVSGGGGDDELFFGESVANNYFNGGAGDDAFHMRRSPSYPVSGGPGRDTVLFADAAEPVATQLGSWTPEFGSEDLVGGPQADELTGNEAANRIHARDGRRDRLSCEGGQDEVIADRPGVDVIAADCEDVDFAGPASEMRVLGVRVPQTVGGLLTRGVRAQVRCSNACRATIRLSTGASAVSRGVPGVLGERSLGLRAGQTRWVTVRLRPAARRALADGRPRGFHVRTRLAATFADGVNRRFLVVRSAG